jgi:hypothetical protein
MYEKILLKWNLKINCEGWTVFMRRRVQSMENLLNSINAKQMSKTSPIFGTGSTLTDLLSHTFIEHRYPSLT